MKGVRHELFQSLWGLRGTLEKFDCDRRGLRLTNHKIVSQQPQQANYIITKQIHILTFPELRVGKSRELWKS